jgi:tetratricopeptide (TPR) repeat protein
VNTTKNYRISPAGVDAGRDEDVLHRCGMSKSSLEAGDYERAREFMGELWRRVGERPAIEGLGERAAAELLLHAGRLTSTIGGARRIEGAQEAGKNLVSESTALFEHLGDAKKVAEARAELGLCYWREGAYDEARVVIRAALDALSRADGDQTANTLVRLSVVEFSAGRYDTVLELLADAAPLVESSESDYLKGCFHNHRAVTLRTLADAARDAELRDRALVEYTAASYHFERAGHTRYQAHVENNLALLFNNIGRHAEAHEHLDRARPLFVALKDAGSVAQCDDTRARILLTEGKFEEAERAVSAAVRSTEAGDRQALLAECLTTLGTAQARGGKHDAARRSLLRAVSTAEAAGDADGAGQSALTLVEELCDELAAGELCEVFEHAAELLSNSREQATLARLSACARRVVAALSPSASEHEARSPPHGSPEKKWAGFSLKDEVLRYESELIGRALKDADGVVSRAAKLLGFKHHQTFVALLNNRHKSLLHARTPIVQRRRPMLRLPARRDLEHHQHADGKSET